jgi:hypothetical protein
MSYIDKISDSCDRTDNLELIDMYFIGAKHAALRSKSKDWLARNQNNVSEWGDMSLRGLLFQ